MPQITPPSAKKLNQKQKILALMCRQPDKWFYPYEFMRPDLGALFVGYKAPTRICELHAKYPFLFEKKAEDKYMQRKLNIDKIAMWYHSLSPELKETVNQFLPVEHIDPSRPF